MIRSTPVRFRLYVAGDALNSLQAIANLAALCAAHLQDQHEIEVVDVLRQPMRAFDDRILMTPTLLRIGPLPVLKIVGNLSQTQTVLQALGLHGVAA